MKRVFVDTNVLIDLLSRRHPHYESAAQLFSLADKKQIELAVSALTIANTSYILQKQIGTNETKKILRTLQLIINILPLTDKIIALASNDDKFIDFEDGLQFFSAVEFKQDVIVTRNLKDFKKSTIPVLSAEQFLQTLNL
jgi:predicted nucleic acid-binding protein